MPAPMHDYYYDNLRFNNSIEDREREPGKKRPVCASMHHWICFGVTADVLECLKH